MSFQIYGILQLQNCNSVEEFYANFLNLCGLHNQWGLGGKNRGSMWPTSRYTFSHLPVFSPLPAFPPPPHCIVITPVFRLIKTCMSPAFMWTFCKFSFHRILNHLFLVSRGKYAMRKLHVSCEPKSTLLLCFLMCWRESWNLSIKKIFYTPLKGFLIVGIYLMVLNFWISVLHLRGKALKL